MGNTPQRQSPKPPLFEFYWEREILDLLNLIPMADKNGVVGFDDDEITDAAEGDGAFPCDNDIAPGVERHDGADQGIILGILAKMGGECCP